MRKEQWMILNYEFEIVILVQIDCINKISPYLHV
jgi:hypothetical protein